MKNVKVSYSNNSKPKKIKLKVLFPFNKKIKILVLSGGGVKGIAHIGVARCLEKLNMLNDIHTIAGTSVGALIGGMLYIGYTPKEIEAFSMKLDFNLLKETDLNLFLESYGLDDGYKIEHVIKTLIKIKFNKDNITLKEIHDIIKKKFIAVTTCVETGKTHYVDYTNYPELPLYLAIKMSLCIPFVFCPVEYNNCYFVDGAVTCNFPIEIFSKNIDQVLGIYLRNTQDIKPIESIKDYIIKLASSLADNVTDELLNKYADNTIIIDLPNMPVADFNLSNEQKRQMYLKGYLTCLDKLCPSI
jgi:NTE family protein